MPRFGTHTLDFDVVIATEDKVLDARHFNVLYGVFSSCGADYFAYVEPKMFQAFFLVCCRRWRAQSCVFQRKYAHVCKGTPVGGAL